MIQEAGETAHSGESCEVTLSVVIPVRNSPDYLRQCLDCLQASTFRDFEIIVVDDASTDDTRQIAEQHDVKVLQMDECVGPAKARNRGAEVARGEYLFFLDADVCTYPDTITEVVRTFRSDSSIDALFGSYDTKPTAWNIVSQYRNLLHHFTHQEANEEASTFWSGCGAIKRTVFYKMNGFDTDYRAPCIEDIELGIRMRKAGHRIRLNKDIQVTHLKRWTLWSTVKTDFWYRGVPWTQLMVGDKTIPNDLNVKFHQRLCVILAGVLVLLLAAGAWYSAGMIFLPIGTIAAIVLLDWWTVKYRVPTIVRYLAVLATVAVAAYMVYLFGFWAILGLGVLVAIVLLNYRFYAFFARERHPMFAALVLPMHVIYFLYCGLSFATGVALGMWKNWTRPSVQRRAANST